MTDCGTFLSSTFRRQRRERESLSFAICKILACDFTNVRFGYILTHVKTRCGKSEGNTDYYPFCHLLLLKKLMVPLHFASNSSWKSRKSFNLCTYVHKLNYFNVGHLVLL